jgi:TonB C terminal
MRREASIPLFLWIATAVLAHLLWGGGADQAATVIEDRLDVGRFASGIRSHVRSAIAPPLEIAIDDESAPDEEIKPSDEPDEEQDDGSVSDDEADDAKLEPPPKLEPKRKPEPPPEKEEAKDPTLKQIFDSKKEEEPDKPEEKPAEPVKPAEEPPPALTLPSMPNKIAVKQHVEKEQPDNPDAQYIADKANKVAEETRATITSTDQDHAQPTPGSAPSGPKGDPGNAEETRVAQDTEQAGEEKMAPGGSQSQKAERLTSSTPIPKSGTEASAAAPGPAGAQTQKAAAASVAQSEEENQKARAPTPEQLGAPEVVASNEGSFSTSRPEAAAPEQKARKAKKKLPPRKPRSLIEAMGLGAAGRTPGGVALNLTPNMANESIGSDELSRLRRADGERRRSQHRGSWSAPGLERYRSAIENYVPTVKPGNQTALNTAAVPFATYLTQIHNRIHPIFADGFLSSLDRLPASHPLNDQNLVTALEIVVEREEGRLVRRGVTRTSGVTAFDISAIAAVERASPFGVPPDAIVSPDGNVYLHWEFRRDAMACSTMYAHPYILKGQPKPAPLPTTPTQPPFRGPDDQLPAKGERHGQLEPAPKAGEPAPQG